MKYDKWEDICDGDYIYLYGEIHGVDAIHGADAIHDGEDRSIDLISLVTMGKVTVTKTDLPDMEIAHRLKKGDQGLVLPQAADLIRKNSVRLTEDQLEALPQKRLQFQVEEVRTDRHVWCGNGTSTVTMSPASRQDWWVKSTMVVPFKIGSHSEVMFPEVFGSE